MPNPNRFNATAYTSEQLEEARAWAQAEAAKAAERAELEAGAAAAVDADEQSRYQAYWHTVGSMAGSESTKEARRVLAFVDELMSAREKYPDQGANPQAYHELVSDRESTLYSLIARYDDKLSPDLQSFLYDKVLNGIDVTDVEVVKPESGSELGVVSDADVDSEDPESDAVIDAMEVSGALQEGTAPESTSLGSDVSSDGEPAGMPQGGVEGRGSVQSEVSKEAGVESEHGAEADNSNDVGKAASGDNSETDDKAAAREDQDRQQRGAEAQRLSEELEAQLSQARIRFIKAKLAVETHVSKRFFGGERRQKELASAREEYIEVQTRADAELLKKSIREIRERLAASAGEVTINALIANEIARHTLRSINSIEAGVSEAYENMLSQRNGMRRAGAKLGRWFTDGGRLSKWLKGGGSGAAMSAGVVLSGVGWPITTVAGLGLTTAVKLTSKEAILESQRGENRTLDFARARNFDITRDELSRQEWEDPEEGIQSAVETSIANLAYDSERDSVHRQDRLRRGVGSAALRFGMGYAAGSIVTGISRTLVSAGTEHNNISTFGNEHIQTEPTPTASGEHVIDGTMTATGNEHAAATATSSPTLSGTAGTEHMSSTATTGGSEHISGSPTATVEALKGAENFPIEYGNGITQEFSQFLSANGIAASPDELMSLYNQAIAEFGPGGIFESTQLVWNADSSQWWIPYPVDHAEYAPGVAQWLFDTASRSGR